MSLSPRSHASTVVDSIRWCATAVDRGRPRFKLSVWMLLKFINARFVIPYHPHVWTLPKVMDSARMSSMTVDGFGAHAKASVRNATLILDCWLLHMAEHFGTVSWYFVQYRIVSYSSFFPTAISCHRERHEDLSAAEETLVKCWECIVLRLYCCCDVWSISNE